MLRITRLLPVLLLLLTVAACRPQPEPLPTAAPPPITPTPEPTVPTATPIPTRAPLPTEIPREDRFSGNNTNTADPIGQIRVIHGVPDLDAVDVFLDDRTIAFSLRYGRESGQSTLLAGDYTLALRPTGSSLDAPTLLEMPITLTPDTPQLVVLTRNADTLQAMLHTESTAPVQAGQTRISVVHAIPDGPETTILLPTEFADQPPDLAFPRITYSQQSEPYSPPVGDLELNFEELFDAYPLSTRPRRSYTLALVGTSTEPQVVVANIPVKTSAPVTFVNVAEATGPVDVYLDGEPVLQPVFFEDDDLIRDVVTGTHEISIYQPEADPAETEPLLTTTVSLTESGETYLVLMGPPDDLLLVTHQERNQPLDDEETRITLINAVPEYPILVERRSAPTPLRVGYGQPLTRIYLTQSLDFEFVSPQTTPDDDITVVEFLSETNYEAGISYIIFVTGEGQDDPDPYVLDRPVPNSGTPEDPTANMAQAYLANATNHNLEVLFNGDIADSDLPPGRGTLAQVLTPGENSVTLLDADTGEALHTGTVTLQANVSYSLVFSGSAGTYNLLDYPANYDTDTAFAPVFARMINVSRGSTRALAFAYMPAVTPERRLSNVIASPQTDFKLPREVPRIRGFESITSGQATTFYPLSNGRFDFHIYATSDERLYASVYDVVLEDDGVYDIIVVPDGEVTPYAAFVVEVPVP